MTNSINSKVCVGLNGKEYTRTLCEVYTRCMGYYRPVSQFNGGKKSEFYSRNYFKEDNINFNKQYEGN